jgi:hypothetical protein
MRHEREGSVTITLTAQEATALTEMWAAYSHQSGHLFSAKVATSVLYLNR